VDASVNNEGLLTFNKSIELLPYKPRVFIEREFLTDEEILSNVGATLFLDVECYPNYFLCSFKLHKTNKFIVLEAPFNPKFLSWLLHNYKTVGFNSIKYDMLMLWASYANQDTYRLKDISNAIILQGMRPQELKKEYGFFTYKTDTIDLIEVAPLKGSLKLYGARLHSPRIQDLPIPDTKELTEEEIEIVKQYNFNDLDVTEQLFDFMKERIELREALGIEYNEDLRSKSDAQIAEVILAKELTKLNGSRPKRAEIDTETVYRYSCPHYLKFQTPDLQALLQKVKLAKFQVEPSGKMGLPKELNTDVALGTNNYRLGIGGLHSSEKNVAYMASNAISIVDRDVASYYPRLITTLNLFPPSCGPNFLIVINKLIETRLDAKKRKIFTRDKGLKIVINGLSGKLSDVWSIFYSPDNTIQMTVTGQLDLLMLIEAYELNGIQVISANTDGIVSLVRKDQEDLFLQLTKLWEKTTGFVTEETRYDGYFARDVNAYFAVKTDKTTKKKGPYSEVGSQSGTKLDTNPVNLICSDAIEGLLANGIPIEQTIKDCKDFTRFVTVRQVKGGAHKSREYLGKVVRYYYSKGEIGTINYCLTGNKVPETDGAKPAMDLPKELPDDIDYNRYIKITNEMLIDIGYTKRPTQLRFF
jgi:hypothetical protein